MNWNNAKSDGSPESSFPLRLNNSSRNDKEQSYLFTEATNYSISFSAGLYGRHFSVTKIRVSWSVLGVFEFVPIRGQQFITWHVNEVIRQTGDHRQRGEKNRIVTAFKHFLPVSEGCNQIIVTSLISSTYVKSVLMQWRFYFCRREIVRSERLFVIKPITPGGLWQEYQMNRLPAADYPD